MAMYYAPAGAFPSYTSGVLVWWKKLPSSKHDFSKPPEGKWLDKEFAAHVKAGDREILICMRPDKWTPTTADSSWDGVLNTSFYQKGGLGEQYLRYTLISVHNGLKTKLWNRDFITSDKIKILGDSGGAQIKSRVIPYLDPTEIITWNNAVTDYAIALDIAPSPVDILHDDVVQVCAELQAKHNKVFQEKRGDRVKLVNVMHGHTLRQQLDYYQRVQNDYTNAWASGSDNYNSELSWVRNLLIPMMPTIKAKKAGKELPRDSELFHLFGITGRVTVPLLAWLGKYVPTLTVDSTGWLFAVRTMTMELITPSGAMRAIPQGKSSATRSSEVGRQPNDYQIIPCSCEVCSIVRYTSVFDQAAKCKTSGLLATHNWITMANYIESWNKAAQNITSKAQYLNHVYESFNESQYTRIRRAIDYIECAINEGLQAADANPVFYDHLHAHSTPATEIALAEAAADGTDPFETIDYDELQDKQEEMTKRLEGESDEALAYYQKAIDPAPCEAYRYSGKGAAKDGLDSISVYAFPYYFTREELEQKKLSTHDRIIAHNYMALRSSVNKSFEFSRAWLSRQRIDMNIKKAQAKLNKLKTQFTEGKVTEEEYKEREELLKNCTPPGCLDSDWLTQAIALDKKSGIKELSEKELSSEISPDDLAAARAELSEDDTDEVNPS